MPSFSSMDIEEAKACKGNAKQGRQLCFRREKQF